MKTGLAKKGTSLVELLVTLSIFSLLILVVGGLFNSAKLFSDWNYQALTLQKEIRQTLSQISGEIREASASSPNPITIGANSITFEIPADVAQNQVISWTQIRYDLGTDSTVRRTANGQTTLVGNSVQSMSFVYPVSAQTSPNTVQIQITGRRNTLNGAITVTLTGQVTLRNF